MLPVARLSTSSFADGNLTASICGPIALYYGLRYTNSVIRCSQRYLSADLAVLWPAMRTQRNRTFTQWWPSWRILLRGSRSGALALLDSI
jgi:hypothetical protein